MTIHQEQTTPPRRLALAPVEGDETFRGTPIDYRKCLPRAWYIVCRSADLPRTGERRIVSRDLLGHPLVLFRSEDGTPRALDAHCPHMGTHLGSASLRNDCLVCPMHHWSFEGTGRCRNSGGAGAGGRDALRSWPVAERYGAVFVFMGTEALYDLPRFDFPEDSLISAAGKPVTVECPWVSVSANAYDMQHLRTVHGRALRETPTVEQLDRFRLRLRYVSRVTGTGSADRVMKWLSGDAIHVCITCYGGPVFTVESRLKSRHSMLLLGILPATTPAGGVTITPLFVRQRGTIGAVDRAGLAVAGWLFTRFLEKDLGALHRMEFHAPEGLAPDDPLRQFLDFVDGLPKVSF